MGACSEEATRCLVLKLLRANVPRVLVMAVVLLSFNPRVYHEQDRGLVKLQQCVWFKYWLSTGSGLGLSRAVRWPG